MGVAYELYAITAAVVGGCSLAGGVGSIRGTVLGLILIQIVIKGTGLIPWAIDSTQVEGLVLGTVVVLAVGVQPALPRPALRPGPGSQRVTIHRGRSKPPRPTSPSACRGRRLRSPPGRPPSRASSRSRNSGAALDPAHRVRAADPAGVITCGVLGYVGAGLGPVRRPLHGRHHDLGGRLRRGPPPAHDGRSDPHDAGHRLRGRGGGLHGRRVPPARDRGGDPAPPGTPAHEDGRSRRSRTTPSSSASAAWARWSADELAAAGVPLLVIDAAAERLAEVERHGHLGVIGDATEEKVLQDAGPGTGHGAGDRRAVGRRHRLHHPDGPPDGPRRADRGAGRAADARRRSCSRPAPTT